MPTQLVRLTKLQKKILVAMAEVNGVSQQSILLSCIPPTLSEQMTVLDQLEGLLKQSKKVSRSA